MTVKDVASFRRDLDIQTCLAQLIGGRQSTSKPRSKKLTINVPFSRYVLAVNRELYTTAFVLKPIATKPRILPINGRVAIKSIHDRVARTTNVRWLAPPPRFIALIFECGSSLLACRAHTIARTSDYLAASQGTDTFSISLISIFYRRNPHNRTFSVLQINYSTLTFYDVTITQRKVCAPIVMQATINLSSHHFPFWKFNPAEFSLKIFP